MLSVASVTTLGDEDDYLPVGPLYPLPPLATPWMGPIRDIPYVGESQVQDSIISSQHVIEEILADANQHV
jgi:hypothetical protein